jgi:hypothetical protein
MTTTIAQEHIGLAKVHATCAAMNAIWRPTIGTDLGVDGQIELLEPDTIVSTGHIVAAQIKSGPSYFKDETAADVPYYASPKHRRYWERLKLPVILILHHPDRDLTIYANIKPEIIKAGPIRVPKTQIFSSAARSHLLDIENSSEQFSYIDPDTVLSNFKEVLFEVEAGKQISGIDFLLATVNLDGGYFELRMRRIVELIYLALGRNEAFINQDTYDFILRCVMKFWRWKLTEPFEEEFDQMWWDLHMVPDILLPLNQTGERVIDHLWERLDDYVSIDTFGHLQPNNAKTIARIISSNAQAASQRLDLSDRLGEEPR